MERNLTKVQPIRVIIVDDSAVTRDAMRALLATSSDIELIGEATNGEDALRLVEQLRPEVVLMDLEMPRMGGVEATRLIKQSWPLVSVIVVTISASQRNAALNAGADSFIVKGEAPHKLLTAMRRTGVSGNFGEM